MNPRGIALLLLAVLPLTAAAATYRWTDEHGQVHYSQVPPAGRKYDTVGSAPPPAAAPNQDALNKSLEQSVKDEPKRKEAEAKTAQEKAQREDRCKRGLERLAFLDARTAHRLVKTDDKGNPVRFTEEDFQKERGETQQQIKRDCD